MNKLSYSKLIKFLSALLLFGFLVVLNPYEFFSPFRNAFSFALVPFQKIGYSFSLAAYNVTSFFSSIGQLKYENEKLLQENATLLSENARLKDFENENNILKQQLDLTPRDKYNLTAAYIVAQDPQGLGNWIEIDKGSDEGVSEGMAVIVSKGILVGKIEEVWAKSSKVMLVTNTKTTINSMTSMGAKGVVKGEYGLGLILDMVLQTDEIKIGDDVITSGIGSNIPRGFYIGKIQEVHPSNDHLFQQAVVTSPLQISKLEVVFVVKNN